MKFDKVCFDDISIDTFNQFKHLKAIVFDFDGTLYKNIDWTGYDAYVLNGARKYFRQLSDIEFKQLLNKYNVKEDSITEDLARLFTSEKNSNKEYVKFTKTIKFEGDFSRAKTFSSKLLEELSKQYQLYILSNSSVPNIKFVSKKINLNLKSIKKIYSNKFEVDDLSKTKRLKELLQKLDAEPSQILMVGDSVNNDLIPAKNLGLKTLHIVD